MKGMLFSFSTFTVLIYISFDCCFSSLKTQFIFPALDCSSVAFIIQDCNFCLRKTVSSIHHTSGVFSFCSPRMENGVLGNALEGVHVEEEEGEKTEDESLVENNDNIDGMWSCM